MSMDEINRNREQLVRQTLEGPTLTAETARTAALGIQPLSPGFENDLEAWKSGKTDRLVIGRAAQAPRLQEAVEQPPGMIGSAFVRGVNVVKGDLAALGGFMAGSLGFEDLETALFDTAKGYQEANGQLPRQVGRIEDIQSARDAVVWGTETLVETMPLLASMLIPGGVVGKVAGRGAGYLTAAGVNAAIQTGESAQIVEDVEGKSAAEEKLKVVGTGLGKAALDLAPLGLVAKLVGAKVPGFNKILDRYLVEAMQDAGVVKRMAGNVAAIGVAEATTETLQETVNIALDKTIREHRWDLSPEDISQLKNAAAGGFIFGLVGIPAGIIGKPSGEIQTPEDQEAVIGGIVDDLAAGQSREPAETSRTPETEDRSEVPVVPEEDTSTRLADVTDGYVFPQRDADRTNKPDPSMWAKSPPQTPLGQPVDPNVLAVWTGKDGTAAAGFQMVQTRQGYIVSQAGQQVGTSVDPKVVETELAARQVQPEEAMAKASDEQPVTSEEDLDGIAIEAESRQGPPATAVDAQIEEVARAEKTTVEKAPDPQPRKRKVESPAVEALKAKLDKIYADPKSRRTSDGQLTKAAKQKVQILEDTLRRKRDEAVALEPIEEDIDFDSVEVPTAAPATAKEQKAYERMIQKELDEGLSDAEYERLSVLQEKMDSLQAQGSAKRSVLTRREALQQRLPTTKALIQQPGAAKAREASIFRAMADTASGGFWGKATAQERVQRAKKILMDRLGKFLPKEAMLHVRLIAAEDLRDSRVEGAKQFVNEWRADYEAGHDVPSALAAAFESGQSIIVVDATQSSNHLVGVYLHEVAAHLGLRGLFKTYTDGGLARFEKFLLGLYKQVIKSPELKARLMEVDAIYADYWLDVAEEITGAKFPVALKREDGHVYEIRDPDNIRFKNEHYLKYLMEEFLGKMAENTPLRSKAGQVWAKVVKFFRQMFRMQLREEDIQTIIMDGLNAMAREFKRGSRFGTAANGNFYFRDPTSEAGVPTESISLDAAVRQAFETVAPTNITYHARSSQARQEQALRQFYQGANNATDGELAKPENRSAISRLLDVWGARYRANFFTPLQIAEYMQNKYGILEPKLYMEVVQQYWARKSKEMVEGNAIAEDWGNMHAQQAYEVGRAAFEVAEASKQLNRRLNNEELKQVFDRLGTSPAAIEMWQRVDQSFLNKVNTLAEQALKAKIRQMMKGTGVDRTDQLYNDFVTLGQSEFARSLVSDMVVPGTLPERLGELDREFDGLRNRNYFPREHFGRYTISVRATKDAEYFDQTFTGPQAGQKGQMIWFEKFTTLEAQKKRAAELEKKFRSGDTEILLGSDTDPQRSMRGLPPKIVEEIAEILELPPEMVADLQDAFEAETSGTAYIKFLQGVDGPQGFSNNALKAFAAWHLHSANHIARIAYKDRLENGVQAFSRVRENVRERVGDRLEAKGDVTAFDELTSHFRKHVDYLMDPGTDLAKYRAMGFMWYLGFNVKSAFVNMTQVPVVGYSFLAARYGDRTTAPAIMKAYGEMARLVKPAAADTTLPSIEESFDTALARGIEEGFINESYATTLAGLAEEGVLERFLPEDKTTFWLQRFSYYGSFLFRHAEMYNRLVTFRAAWNLAKQNRRTDEEAFYDAREAVQTTMFEYAKWNRPNFMRGNKSIFFVFWSYMQNMAWLAGGGAGKQTALRMLTVMFLAAGLQGLPFAENVLDLFDFTATEVKEALGWDDPLTESRVALRALAQEIGANPDFIMHGLGKNYGLGPLHVLEAFGVPVPNVDISGSLSSGQIIPGTSEFLAQQQDPDAKLGRTVAQVLGPVAAVPITFFQAMSSSSTDQWKRWERTMPSALKSLSAGARRWTRGEESFNGGGAVVTFEPNNMEHRMENVAQALGFSNARISDRYELKASQEYMKQYWSTRRTTVMENYGLAILSGDATSQAQAGKAVRQFNESVPAPALRISAQALRRSVQTRFGRVALRERGLPHETAFLELFLKREGLFPSASAEVSSRRQTE